MSKEEKDPFASATGGPPPEYDDDRSSAMLTPAQREFLRDPSQYDETARPTYRKRVRDRVRDTLMDFDYLRRLSIDDRQMILDGLPRHRYDALLAPVQFMYTLTKMEAGLTFREVVQDAAVYGEHQLVMDGKEYEIHADVKLEISKNRVPGPEEAREKLEGGGELTDAEIGVLLRKSGEEGYPDPAEVAAVAQKGNDGEE